MAKSQASGKAPASGIDFRKKLKDAGKLWAGAKKKAAEKTANQGSEYEDGRYLAKLMGGEIGTSSGGRLQLTWKWRFEEEPYEGKIKNAYQGLENEDNLVFLARDLERLGYEAPDDLASVEAILEDVKKSKPIARIRLKTKAGSDFQNVYIDKVISGDEDEDAEETEEEEVADAETEETEEESTEDAGEEEEAEEEEEAAEEEEEEEEAVEEEEDDEVEVEVGLTVEVDSSKGKVIGEIIEILEAEGKVRVKTTEGKVLKVGLDKVTLATPAAPAAAPAKKAAVAAAPAPAAKKKVKK